MLYKKHPERFIRHFISAPFIYSVLFPLVILDLFIELYHRISFPLYGIPYVKRNDYIIFDRQKLEYLSLFDKFNCTYCAYANGLLPYASKIASETEKYWCSIKHKKYEGYKPEHHEKFLNYSDAEAYKKLARK